VDSWRTVLDRRTRSTFSSWLAIGIIVLHLCLGAIYSVVTPLWESFDEWGHYPYVEYIARERALPHEPLVEKNDETHQPPLYYVLGALAISWIDTTDDAKWVENRYSVHRGGRGGMSFYLRSPDERFPYRGTALAAHIIRLVSVILSTVPVLTTYLTASTLFPDRKDLALGAMAVSAFWPQLLFMGGVINNDIAVTASVSLVLLFLVRMLVQSPRSLNMLGLGLSLGATLLSKRNGLPLVPFVVGVLVVIAFVRRRDGKVSWALLAGALLLSAGLVLGLLWWLKDLGELYMGHLSRIVRMLSRPGQLRQLRWGRLPSGLYFCLATFFASFGHLLLGVEPWIYGVVAVVCLIALLGVFAFFAGKRSVRITRIGIMILVFHVLVILAAPAYRVLTQGGDPVAPIVIDSIQSDSPLLFSKGVFLFQGRFVLPAISSFSILLVVGLASLVPEHCQTALLAGVSIVLLAFSAMAPFRYIRPVYAVPTQLSASQLQEMDYGLDIEFGDKIKLLGYEMEASEARSNTEVSVTLYWRCLSEMKENHGLRIQILGTNAQVYGTLHLHPGHGNFPTSLWEKGDTFRETYRVPIAQDVPTPSLAYFKVSFLPSKSSGDTLLPLNANNHPTGTAFGQLIVRAYQEPQVKDRTYYELAEKIGLVGYRIDSGTDGEVRITLFWQALTDVERDYTVFIHLVDNDGDLVGQRDSQPNNGLSPTSIWKTGEVIEDEHVISLSPATRGGRYSVRVGLYDLRTMKRLPAFDADGSRLPHDVIVLGETQPSSRTTQSRDVMWALPRLLAQADIFESQVRLRTRTLETRRVASRWLKDRGLTSRA